MDRLRTLKHIIKTLKNRKVLIDELTEILPDEFAFLNRMIDLLINKYENHEIVDLDELISHDPELRKHINWLLKIN